MKKKPNLNNLAFLLNLFSETDPWMHHQSDSLRAVSSQQGFYLYLFLAGKWAKPYSNPAPLWWDHTTHFTPQRPYSRLGHTADGSPGNDPEVADTGGQDDKASINIYQVFNLLKQLLWCHFYKLCIIAIVFEEICGINH